MKTALLFDCYDDYQIRIQYIQHALEKCGYQVRIFFSDYDHYQKKYVTHRRHGIEYLHAKAYQKNLSYKRMHSHAAFAKTCVAKAESFSNVSLVYVMVPPNSMCKEFAQYKKKHPEVKLVFDVLDMWPESLPLSQTIKSLAYPLLKPWQGYRDNYLDSADCVLSECNLFTKQIENVVDSKKLHTVYLCGKRDENHPKWKEDYITFLYCGSINHLIHIDLIVSFLKEVNSYKKVVLHVIGNGETKDLFLEKVKENQIEIVDYGIVYDPIKKRSIYQNCMYGLNMMVDTVFVGLTMKSIDYLSHDLPLINNIKGDTWDFVENNHLGVNVKEGQIESAAKFIVEQTKEEYYNMQKNVVQVFEQHLTEEVVEKELVEIIEQFSLIPTGKPVGLSATQSE